MTPSTIAAALDYDALRDALTRADAVVAAAELHGGVCAALCAGGPRGGERWLVTCLDDEDLRDPMALEPVLRELLEASWRMLEGDDLVFAPLLPDDDAEISEQVQALALWCQGFLGGLGDSAPDAPELREAGGEATAAEILADFAEISRAGLSDEEAAGLDRPDFALAELVEYVRVGVQLIHVALAGRRAERVAEH